MNEIRALIVRPEEPDVLDLPPLEVAPPYPVLRDGRDGEERATLREFWLVLVKRRWLALGVTLLATASAAVYLARRPQDYEAQARVQVNLENSNSPLSGMKGGSVVFSNPVNDPAYFNTQMQILSDPGLLYRVVKTLDLEHNQNFLRDEPERRAPVWQSLSRMFGAGADEGARAPEPVPLVGSIAPATTRDNLVEATRLAPYVERILKGLNVQPVVERRTGGVKDTRLIDIRFRHYDPQLSARVANAVADAFALSNIEEKTQTTSNAGSFLQKRIAELQGQIRDGEERLIGYAKQNQILSLDASQNTVIDRLTGLNKQLLEAENERKEAEAAYRASLAPGAAEALASEGAKQAADAEAKLSDLKRRRAELLVETTEKWPEVREIDQQAAALESFIKESRARATAVVTTNLETRFRQAADRERGLREAFDQQRAATLTQNEAAVNYRIIQQEIETNKALLDGLLQRSKENDVALAGTPNNITIRHYAIAPDKPYGADRLHLLALALVASAALGVGCALFAEYLDDTVGSTEKVEETLRLPAIAVIPTIGGAARRRLLGSRAARQGGGERDESLLIAGADARSPLAEAYRHLRTSVLLSTPGRAPKALLVTSSQPGEGKTTVSLNTAISLAQTGARVLVIDADMRRPRLHTLLDVSNGQGLSNLLSSGAGPEEVSRAVRRHEAAGVHFISSGPTPPNPAELLGSAQMRRLLGILGAEFDHIVIDSPPVASVTDGVLLSTMVDGVLLVVHGSRTSRHVVRRTRQMLLDVRAKVFGVVLNNVTLRRHDYYYNSYYHDAYHQQLGPGVEGAAAG